MAPGGVAVQSADEWADGGAVFDWIDAAGGRWRGAATGDWDAGGAEDFVCAVVAGWEVDCVCAARRWQADTGAGVVCGERGDCDGEARGDDAVEWGTGGAVRVDAG